MHGRTVRTTQLFKRCNINCVFIMNAYIYDNFVCEFLQCHFLFSPLGYSNF